MQPPAAGPRRRRLRPATPVPPAPASRLRLRPRPSIRHLLRGPISLGNGSQPSRERRGQFECCCAVRRGTACLGRLAQHPKADIRTGFPDDRRSGAADDQASSSSAPGFLRHFRPGRRRRPRAPGLASALVPSVRGFKIAENQSPQPQDRVFFTFDYFSDLNGALNRRFESPVNNLTAYRYIFGLEKTFDDGYGSFGVTSAARSAQRRTRRSQETSPSREARARRSTT